MRLSRMVFLFCISGLLLICCGIAWAEDVDDDISLDDINPALLPPKVEEEPQVVENTEKKEEEPEAEEEKTTENEPEKSTDSDNDVNNEGTETTKEVTTNDIENTKEIEPENAVEKDNEITEEDKKEAEEQESLETSTEAEPQKEEEPIQEEPQENTEGLGKASGIDEVKKKVDEPQYREEITPLSGTKVRYRLNDPEHILKLNPELTFGGLMQNYRVMGNSSRVAFGGGIGATYKNKWHFRFNVKASQVGHHSSNQGVESDHSIWFVQPGVYAMYNLARFPEWHYSVPFDLYAGVKLGANVFRTDSPFQGLDNEDNFLWGISILPRFYFISGFGVAAELELATIDYFANYFFHFGVNFFWDFSIEEVGMFRPKD